MKKDESESQTELFTDLSTGDGTSKLVDADFDQFYAAFPRKQARKPAKDVWMRLRKKKILPTLAVLLSAVEVQKRQFQWRDQQFIPLPSTWLYQQRWNDCCDSLTPESRADNVWEKATCNALMSKH